MENEIRTAANALIAQGTIRTAFVHAEKEAITARLYGDNLEEADRAVLLKDFPASDHRHVEIDGRCMEITYLLNI